MDDFRTERVTDHIFRIVMPYVCCYLIIGKNEAVLIDTGWGYGDLNKTVRSLTSLPTKVLLTHGHADHIGGVSQFSNVFLHPNDFEIAKWNNKIATRQLVMKSLNLPEPNSASWQPEFNTSYQSLAGDYQLGEISIVPIHLPGHTKGSVAYIIPEERIAIFGDACSHPTLLTLEEADSIENHYKGLLELKRHENEFDKVLVSHESFEIDKIVLTNNLRLAEKVLKREDKRIPIFIHGTEALAAREKEDWLPSKKELIGNILYLEDRV